MPYRPILIFALLLISGIQNSYSQPCIDTSFRKSYKTNAYALGVSNHLNLTDHSTIISGHLQTTSSSNKEGLVISINEVGKINWAKKYGTIPFTTDILINTSSVLKMVIYYIPAQLPMADLYC